MTQKLKERISKEIKKDLDQLNQDRLLVKQLSKQLYDAKISLEKSKKSAESSLKKLKRVYKMEENKESELKII